MTGSAPTGSMTPPICAAARQVHALADLRARSDERVRIDERSLADVRADVDEHRRHADDAAIDERAFANRRSARHDAHAGVERRASSAASCPCRRTASGRDRRTRRRCRRSGSRAECPASPRCSRASRTASSDPARRRAPRPRSSSARSSTNAVARGGLVRAGALRRTGCAIVSARLTRALRPRPAGRDPSAPPAPCPSTPARGGTIGSRNTSSHRPIAAIANFTGPGLDSTKLTCMIGSSLSCQWRAAAKSPRSAASTICTISAGTSFDATEMMPRPPIAISGSVSASSPDSTRKSSGTLRQISAICVTLPDASLTPTMFGIVASLSERGRIDVAAGAARHVVDDDRQRRAVGDRLVVRVEAFGRRPVVVRRHGQQAVRAGLLHLRRPRG